MTDKHEKLWEMISGAKACMVTTEDGGVLRSRPMAPYIDPESKTIRFMTERTSAKIEELHHDRDLALSFINGDDMQYVSISGRGEVTTDRGLIKEMWGPASEIWFSDGPDKADVAIITVKPEQAEYWDSDTGKIKMAYEITKAYFTDNTPDIGDNAKLDMGS